MISEDEYLERIVAGIQARTTSAASVVWNEVLNGRQFDVSVRFTNGTLTYLVLIEVKNRVRKASASDIEAFITKSTENFASKSVFVTAAGFQSGAIDAARKHGIELFTVEFDRSQLSLGSSNSTVLIQSQSRAPPTAPVVEVGPEILAAMIEGVTLVYKDGTRAEIPSEQTQMRYYVRHTTLADGRSLDDLISDVPIYRISLGERQVKRVKVKPPQKIAPPDEYFFKSGVVREVVFSAVGEMARLLSGNIRFDPAMIRSKIIYRNVLSGEVSEYSLDQLPMQFEELRSGEFYCLEHPLRYFYCDRIANGMVSWVLVESFQAEQLLQAEFTQEARYGSYMVPVKDKATIARLNKRLEDVRARGAASASG